MRRCAHMKKHRTPICPVVGVQDAWSKTFDLYQLGSVIYCKERIPCKKRQSIPEPCPHRRVMISISIFNFQPITRQKQAKLICRLASHLVPVHFGSHLRVSPAIKIPNSQYCVTEKSARYIVRKTINPFHYNFTNNNNNVNTRYVLAPLAIGCMRMSLHLAHSAHTVRLHTVISFTVGMELVSLVVINNWLWHCVFLQWSEASAVHYA